MPEPVLLLLGEVHIWFEYWEVIFGCMTAEPLFPFAHLITMPAHYTTVID